MLRPYNGAIVPYQKLADWYLMELVELKAQYLGWQFLCCAWLEWLGLRLRALTEQGRV
jgi:hypothetical protein